MPTPWTPPCPLCAGQGPGGGFTLLAQAKAQRENRVELQKIKQGYQVTCHISGGDMDLMAVTLYVPDRAQAERVKRSFYKDPRGGLQAGAGLFDQGHQPGKGVFHRAAGTALNRLCPGRGGLDMRKHPRPFRKLRGLRPLATSAPWGPLCSCWPFWRNPARRPAGGFHPSRRGSAPV